MIDILERMIVLNTNVNNHFSLVKRKYEDNTLNSSDLYDLYRSIIEVKNFNLNCLLSYKGEIMYKILESNSLEDQARLIKILSIELTVRIQEDHSKDTILKTLNEIYEASVKLENNN